MSNPEDARRKAALAYNAAADHYDDTANAFWSRFGRRTIERLAPAAGTSVLDVCCGSGASALPAAQAVGPEGHVLAVDLAAELIALARAKALRSGLRNLEFRVGDMLEAAAGPFDGVVCVFGIFFAPDMPAAVRGLWERVKPGGRIAITTWGRDVFEPVNSIFWNAVSSLRPDLYKSFNPWDRIAEVDSLAAMLAEAGVPDPEVVLEPGTHPISGPEGAWSIVMGSGYRGTVEALSPEHRRTLRETVLGDIERRGVEAVTTNVLYAQAARQRWSGLARRADADGIGQRRVPG